MIRNLVLKLPSLKCTSDYAFSSSFRTRNFRSLSPVQRARTSVDSERSVSCSRVESRHIVDVTHAPRARTLFFSKEYYAQKADDVKETTWREDSKKKEEAKQEVGKKNDVPFETLEQYELEAAKPRPVKSRDVFEAFANAQPPANSYFHLQPSSIKPYGSQDNMYSPTILRPTNLLRYPRRLRKKSDNSEHESKSNTDLNNSRHRNYSTSTDVRQLSTSQNYIAKEGHSSRILPSKERNANTLYKNIDSLKSFIPVKKEGDENLNLFKKISQNIQGSWTEPPQKLEFVPPSFRNREMINYEEREMPYKFSTPEMRRKRKERENLHRDRYYKSSYSDLVKMRLREMEEDKISLIDPNNIESEAATNKGCLGCTVKNIKPGPILQVPRNLPEQRTLTTRSKSNLLSQKLSPTMTKPQLKSTLFSRNSTVDNSQDQRNYSKSKSNQKKGKKKKQWEEVDVEAGCDVCTPALKALHKSQKAEFPYEPVPCGAKVKNKVYLPSRVKLGAVQTCAPPPEHKECIKIEKCPPRADECLVVAPKKLPKIPLSDCVCINPHVPTKAPKLKGLNLKFEDPPKEVCHEPPCQTPRADDDNPYKFKPLKPYVPGDCECVQPPGLTGVKLKRLPKCTQEDICRPTRVCPVIHKCPPRADECLKVKSKPLPVIKPSSCPCIDPHVPNISPPLKKLDLDVPETPRVCPRVISCEEKERADDSLKLTKKKLPKFVPGDCPCKDTPMTDWNPKRLVCEDEYSNDCLVPDPCKTFPRADWGCWEYSDEVCNIVDEKCVEKEEVKCPTPPPPKRHPCDKHEYCKENSGGIREIRHVPKRRYSISSASLKLYEQVKSQNIGEDEGYIKTSGSRYKPPEIKPIETKQKKEAVKYTKSQKCLKLPNNKKLKSASTLSLLKMLNQLESARTDVEEPFLFKPADDGKVNYDKILKKIASSTGQPVSQPKREPKPTSFTNTIKKSKSRSCAALKVTSRAISTSRTICKDEKVIRKKKDHEGKKKCQNIKPTIKSIVCNKTKKCPTMTACADKAREHRPSCKRPHVPICCEKEESPYSAYTDNLEETIKPFTKTPQWHCNRTQYGYYPNPKKEYEPLDESNKKNKKNFSTFQSNSGAKVNSSHLLEMSTTNRLTNAWCNRLLGNTKSIPMSTKALLKMQPTNSIITTQNRTLSSKVFQIMPPPIGKPKGSKSCYDKFLDKGESPKITCTPEEVVAKPRWGCKRDHLLTCKRKPPPFPAFSDCLDEEMEDILTECPLDKEKYLRMQPRFMKSPKRTFYIKPPPPIQGKLDLLKEQQCLREKLGIENVGLTQTCSDFGKPVPLMKTKKLIKERNPDCEKIEELKRQGKWNPPYHNRQKRQICTSSLATVGENCRNLSTLGLNSISEFSKDNRMSLGLKTLYTRNYHALVKSTDKAILVDSEAKLKELTRKMFPDLDESNKIIKLQKNIWKAQYLKSYELLNRQSNLTKRARRYYTTYKTKRKTFLRRHVKGCTLRTYLTRRRVPNNVKLLKYRSVNLRGSRFIKTGRPSSNARKDHSQDNASKKGQPKFTLSNSTLKGQKKIGQRKTSEIHGHKPPFPAFSERKKFSRSSDTKRDRYQPTYNFVIDNDRGQTQQFPEQDKVDRTLSFEYYKCKHGFKGDGTTLDCQSLGFCSKCKDSGDCCIGTPKPKQKKSIVNLFVQEDKRKKPKSSVVCKECNKKPCCCQKEPEDECAEDRRKLEEICMQHCMKCIPCHLPEEEKYCVCREECKKIFQKKSEDCPETNSECREEPECQEEPVECREDKPFCPPVPKTEICEPEPEPIVSEKPPPYRCFKQAKSDCSITSGSGQKITCPPAPCGPKRSRSFTQLENLWQKIVNYFKARPNCPEPGEWKKRALKEKAEKAAKAAGLVVLNPKCLPPEILRTAKVSNDCKVCPKDPCDKSDCESNKSASPRLSRRKFSTVIQQSRSYSRSMSSQNLEEINKLLEETEIKQRQLRYGSSPNFKKEFTILDDRKDMDTSKAMRMSLEKELYQYVDFRDLCCKEGPYSKTYFGYSDIIPSRENILERAWRISIESYNKYNCPKSYTFFNEFLNKIEKSIQSVEDLEKLKTENVLRELDEFLKNHDSDKNKK